MAYSLACADLGSPCPGFFTTESQDELWQHVALHAQQAHPGMEMTPEVTELAKTKVRQV
jgi:predicted small metal-binding protein